MPPVDDDGYRGPGRLVAGGKEINVQVTLAGHLEPLDGRYHWYGRVDRLAEVDAAKRGGATTVVLTLPGREGREGRLAEHDAWGNLRITGVGAPPFDRPAVDVEHPLTR